MKLLIIILLCYASVSFAEHVKSFKVFTFYLNGVNTLPTEAQKNLSALQDLLNIKSNMVNWDILYNSTTGNLAKDLWDVLKQKRQEGKELSIDDYVITYMKSYNLDYPIDSPEYKKLKEEIKQHYIDDPSFVGRNLKEILEQFHDKIPPPYEDVVRVLREYHQTSKTKAYVLLIPHSQGNLYANQLWDVLVNAEQFPKSHLAIFGIANPADKISGTVEQPLPYLQKYTTGDNDSIINSLNFFSTFLPVTNPAMKANVHLENCKDILCHNLIDGYIEANKQNPHVLYIPLLNLLVSLKNNLMKEAKDNNEIRLIFSMWGNTDLDLYDDSNKAICHSSGGEKSSTLTCDENVFNYLDTTQGKFDDYERALFAFNDQLPAGKYYILANLKDEKFPPYLNYQFTSSFLGRVKNGWMYEFDNLNRCENIKLIPHLFEYNDPNHKYFGLTKASLFADESQYKCLSKAPELLRNGRFYIGNVVLY